MCDYDEITEAILIAALPELHAAREAAQRRATEHREPCDSTNPTPSSQPSGCVYPKNHGTHWNGQGDSWQLDGDAIRDDARAQALDEVQVALEKLADQRERRGSHAAAGRLHSIAAYLRDALGKDDHA
jgi:hypothetical protein